MATLTFGLLLLQTVLVYSTFCDNQKECTNIKCDDDLFCRGYESCAETSIESAANVYCVGSLGCADSDYLKASNVYCYGDTACKGANSIEATSGSVVCSGISGCINVNGDIKAQNNVICAGVNSCYGAAGNVEAGGSVSCSGASSCGHIKGIISGYFVEATAEDAARNVIFQIKDKGHFTGSYSAFGSQITSNGNIQCDGPYSCGQGTLSASDDVRLFGYASGYKSIIKQTPVIYGHGYYSAAYSDIYSSASKITAQFYGYYSGYYANVWCDKGSTCTVSCKGTGCWKTTVFFVGDTDVNIEPEGCLENEGKTYNDINCPTLIRYTTATKSKVKRERTEARESTEKWDSLDDQYDFGEPGEPQIMSKIDGAMLLSELDDTSTSLGVYFTLFGTLFGCLVSCVIAHCYYNNKRKDIETLQANLSYT